MRGKILRVNLDGTVPSDSTLRRLLEAAATIRQFDEPTLAAVAGEEDVSGGFAQLCRLSVVRPGDHGLMLHDDARRILAGDSEGVAVVAVRTVPIVILLAVPCSAEGKGVISLLPVHRVIRAQQRIERRDWHARIRRQACPVAPGLRSEG